MSGAPDGFADHPGDPLHFVREEGTRIVEATTYPPGHAFVCMRDGCAGRVEIDLAGREVTKPIVVSGVPCSSCEATYRIEVVPTEDR